MNLFPVVAGALGVLVGVLLAWGYYRSICELQRLEIDDCWRCIYQLRRQVVDAQRTTRLAQGIRDTLPYTVYIHPN